jgi:hypothetical protein
MRAHARRVSPGTTDVKKGTAIAHEVRSARLLRSAFLHEARGSSGTPRRCGTCCPPLQAARQRVK